MYFVRNVIAPWQGGFTVPYVWEIKVRENIKISSKSHKILHGRHFPRFYIMIWSNLQKIETKNFNSDSCFFNPVKLGTKSPAVHFLKGEQPGRSQPIAAISCGLSKVLTENASTKIGESHRRWMLRKTGTEAYFCYSSSCHRLVFCRFEKLFYTFILTRKQGDIFF